MNARIFAFACLVLVPFAAGAQAEEHWTFSVTPYIWLPNVNGTLKYNPPPSGGAPEVDTGPNNYLENLSFALMLSGEARKGRWSIVSDVIYLKFDSEKSNVREINFGGSRENIRRFAREIMPAFADPPARDGQAMAVAAK